MRTSFYAGKWRASCKMSLKQTWQPMKHLGFRHAAAFPARSEIRRLKQALLRKRISSAKAGSPTLPKKKWRRKNTLRQNAMLLKAKHRTRIALTYDNQAKRHCQSRSGKARPHRKKKNNIKQTLKKQCRPCNHRGAICSHKCSHLYVIKSAAIHTIRKYDLPECAIENQL